MSAKEVALKSTSILLFLFFLSLLAVPLCRAEAQETDPENLVQRLVDPTLKSEAARTLLGMGAAALPALGKVLHSKRSSEYVRREILKLLPGFGDKGAKMLRDAVSEPALEYEAARQLAGVKSDKLVAGTMFGLLEKSGNPNVRLLAVEWLAARGNADKLRGHLFELLSDPSAKIRQSASALIADRLGRDAIPTLQEMLRKAQLSRSTANRAMRLSILKTLGAIGRKGNQEGKNVMNTLLLALNEEDEQQVAIDELVSIGPASVSGLLMILKAGDTRRAASAMDALLSIGQAAAPEVVDLLQARHSKMKKMAKQFLCFYQDPAVFPLLKNLYPKAAPEDKAEILEIASLYDAAEPFEFIIAATKDDNPVVRVQAVRLLSRSRREAAVPVLLARAEEDPDLDIRLAAVRGLFTMGESSAVPSFARMVAYEKWQVRLEILKALAFMATPSDIKVMSDQLRHRKSELAGQAARALANTTYLTGQRAPDEWVSDVKGITEAGGGKHKPFEIRSIKAGDETVEVSWSGSGDRVLIYLPASVSHNGRYAHLYLGELASDYTVVVLPFPGCSFGPTEQPSLSECMQRYGRQIDIVRQEYTGKPAVLVAHSVAGFGALSFSAENPGSVERIIWVNPVFPRRYYVETAFRASMESLSARWSAEREYLEMQSGFLSPGARNLYRSRVELSSQVKGNGNAMLVAQGHYGLGWLLDEVFFPYDDTTMQSALAANAAPLLLMFGQQDPTLAENVEAFKGQARTNKNMVLSVLDNSIRHIPVENPEAFQAAVKRFMRDYERARTLEPVGGAPTAVVLQGEQGEFGPSQVFLPMEDSTVTRTSADLVKPSRLSRFLDSREPEKLVSGERKEDEEDLTFMLVAPAEETVPEVEESGHQVAGQPAKNEASSVPEATAGEPELVESRVPEESTAVAVATEPEKTAAKVIETAPEPEKPVETTVTRVTSRSATTTTREERPPVVVISSGTPEDAKSHKNNVTTVTSNERSQPNRTVAPFRSEPAVTDTPSATARRESKVDMSAILGWSLVGLSVAGIGTGVYMHSQAGALTSEANELDPILDPDYDTLFDDKVAQAGTKMNFAYLGYGLGAAAALAGVELLFDWPIKFRKKKDKSVSIIAAPLFAREGAGIILDIR